MNDLIIKIQQLEECGVPLQVCVYSRYMTICTTPQQVLYYKIFGLCYWNQNTKRGSEDKIISDNSDLVDLICILV